MIIIQLILGFILFWWALTALGWLFKWFIVRKLNKFTKNNFSNNPFYDDKQTPHINDNELLVQCAQCGIYVTKTQAIQKSNLYYCSQSHLP